MKTDALYRRQAYADLKGVTYPMISKLLKANKLVVSEIGGTLFIVDCPRNDALFDRPAHNRTEK